MNFEFWTLNFELIVLHSLPSLDSRRKSIIVRREGEINILPFSGEDKLLFDRI